MVILWPDIESGKGHLDYILDGNLNLDLDGHLNSNLDGQILNLVKKLHHI